MTTMKWVAGATLLAWGSMAQAQGTLTMWYHGAGNEVSRIVNQIIADFNAAQADWKVELQSFPQAAYNDSVVAGALAGTLPDILDVDGPVMPNWAGRATCSRCRSTRRRSPNSCPASKAIGVASFTPWSLGCRPSRW